MPEPTKQQIEAQERLFDLLGSHIQGQKPEGWPQKTRVLWEPGASSPAAKFNADVAEALHIKLGIPRSLVLSPSDVDRVSKELKLSDTANKYLHEVAKEGPIDQGLLDVIGIEKPQIANFPFDKLPPANKFSHQDARDLIRFISTDDPASEIPKISKRSAVGHLIRQSQGSDYTGLRDKLRKQYGLTPEDIKAADKILRSGKGSPEEIRSVNNMMPLLERLYPLAGSTDTAAGVARSYPFLRKMAESPPGFSPTDLQKEWGPFKPDQSFFGGIQPRAGGADLSSTQAQAIPLLKREQDSLTALRSKGYNVDDPAFYAKEGRKYSPKELATILEEGSSKKGIEGDIEYVTALEQARAEHERRTGERVAAPTVQETIREDPYVYHGEYRAPTHEDITASWKIGSDTLGELEKQRVAEQKRLTDFITAMKGDPELATAIKPSLDVMGGLNQKLEDLRGKYYGQDLAKHPAYEESLRRNQDLYKFAEKEIEDQMEHETLPALKGRYHKFGVNWSSNPAYMAALDRAKQMQNKRKDDLRLKFSHLGNQEGMARLMSMAPLEYQNVLSQFDTAKQKAAIDQELWKQKRERRALETTELPQKQEARDVQNRLAQEEKKGQLGAAQQNEAQNILNAQREKFTAESPASALTKQQSLLATVTGVPQVTPYQGQGMPFPTPGSAMIPPSNAGAMGTALAALYGANAPQQAPLNINLGGGGGLPNLARAAHAEGGVVQTPSYDSLMQQQLSAIENFIREKERHQNLPVMAVDPQAATMSSMASKMGEAMGPRSMLGAWAQGLGTHPTHQQAHHDRALIQSSRNADLEKMLVDLRKEATKGQGEREHNLAAEALKARELEESIRHNKASEGEMSVYHQLLMGDKKEERERKAKELTPQKLKLMEKHDKEASDASKIIVQSSFLGAVSPYLNTGGNLSKYLSPYNLGAVSKGNTADMMDTYDNKALSLVKTINDAAGTTERTKAALMLAMDSKLGVTKTPETNLANAHFNAKKTGGSLLAQSVSNKLRDGIPYEDILESVQSKYENDKKSLTEELTSWFKRRDFSREEKEKMITIAFDNLNSGFEEALERLEKHQ